MTVKPRFEFRVLDRFKVSDVKTLEELAAQDWEVVDFSWSGNGEGAVLLRRRR